MALPRLAAIGVDLDGLRCYHAIHGLPAIEDPDPVLETALQRFGNLLADLGLRATLFAVGADLEQTAATLKRLAGEHHEVASHSREHDYYLAARPAAAIAADLRGAHEALQSAIGQPPQGFRAPGYTLSAPLLATVKGLHYRYDSSLLPCPLYGAAKNLVRRYYRWRGRESQTLSARWRELLGPRGPYRLRPEFYWRQADEGLLELPIGVAPFTGLPLLGTLLGALPRAAAEALVLAPAQNTLPLCNLELHAIDLVDATDPGVEPALVAAQPELRVPLHKRLSRLAAALRYLSARREMLPLIEAATRY